MLVIPQTLREFRNSAHYFLASQLSKYQGFKPNTKPVPSQVFKGEPVYLRSCVVELHTPERWLKYRRMVLESEEPVKVVKGMYNDPSKLAELFGYWQTTFYKLELTPDGKIPRNKYGNIELFNGPLPDECKWIDLPKLYQVCKRLQVECVPAVWGFEKGPRGGSYPQIRGGVVLKEDVSRITEECARL